MSRFAANLTTMFTELPVAERFRAAREVGFAAVEYLMPYADPVADVRRWLEDAGLTMILLNTRVGDAAKGERGLAALPRRENDFREIFDQSMAYATGLGAGMIHVMAGVVPPGESPEPFEAAFVRNLQAAAPIAEREGIRILIEPLNTRDVPGYLHTRSAHTRRIIEAVGSGNVFMQFDFYHLQIMEGDLGQSLETHFDVIGHVQFSSVPGRNEPQYGEVNAPFLFARLDELGYEGWIGCEYRAKTTTVEGLSWAAPYGIGPG